MKDYSSGLSVTFLNRSYSFNFPLTHTGGEIFKNEKLGIYFKLKVLLKRGHFYLRISSHLSVLGQQNVVGGPVRESLLSVWRRKGKGSEVTWGHLSGPGFTMCFSNGVF